MSVVVLYIPSKDRHGKTIRNRNVFKRLALREMVTRYGGVTESRGIGHWRSDNGETVSERVAVLRSVTQLTDPSRLILPFAAKLAKAMDQECIMIECDGFAEFVVPESVPHFVA